MTSIGEKLSAEQVCACSSTATAQLALHGTAWIGFRTVPNRQPQF